MTTPHIDLSRSRAARRAVLVALLASGTAASVGLAVDIPGVEPAALDQPRINAYVSLTATGAPLTASAAGVDSFNIQAYFDTGASGVLLSNNTADLLGIGHSTYNGSDVIYSDVGVAGSDNFYVSNPIHIALADYHPNRDVDNPDTYASVYTNHVGPIRAQVGPVGAEEDPVVGDLDVFGMPTMAGRVVVMDPKPVNTFLDTMRTYVYAPGTAYRPGQPNTDPGIPSVDKHVKLSYVSFDRFTQTTPAGAPAPTLHTNPFIGPNPFQASDTTPPVTISLGNASVNGSFLLDTGAAASIISKGKAGALGVSYDPNTIDTDNPVLLYNGQPIADQFQLTIGGIGGTKVVSGFYLSSLLLRTDEGAADANNNIRFTDAPVLVSDISVANPNVPGDVYTLDGIFGMNYLVASAQLLGADASGLPLIGNLVRGKFDWVTFDEPNGRLGLSVAAPVPQDQLTWFGNLYDPSRSNWDDASANWTTSESFGIFQNGDRVLFNDITLATTVRLNQQVAPGGVTFDNNDDPDGEGATNYTLIGSGGITGFGGLLKRGTGDLTIRTANTYTGATVVEAGRIVFFAAQDIGPLSVQDGASVLFASSVRHRFEAISVDGSVRVDAGGVIVTRAVGVGATGAFDMNDARLVVGDADASDAGTTPRDLRDVLRAGALNGHGIVSTRALADGRLAIGYIAASAKFGTLPAVWNGEPVDAGQVLVAVTVRGDSNLDFVVNFDDLLAMAQHYGATDVVWSQGDFTYDGRCNFDDLLALAQNYGRSAMVADGPGVAALGSGSFAADWALAQSLLPEPTALLAVGGGLGLIARRPRRKR